MDTHDSTISSATSHSTTATVNEDTSISDTTQSVPSVLPIPQPASDDDDTPRFRLPVDEHDKAKTIKFCSIARPHMRAFHFAWLSFFVSFFGWFALSPLQAEIRDSPLTPWLNGGNFKAQNIIAVAGTIFMRLAIGPFCDRFSPRTTQSILLNVFSLPVFLVGTSQSYWQWTTARFFIGFLGSSFIVTLFWTYMMLSGDILGTASATSVGFGLLGSSVTNALMPQIANGVRNAIGFKSGGVDGTKSRSQLQAEDKAWRYSMIIPGAALLLTSVAMYFLSDDLPEGNYSDLHKAGTKEKTNPFVSMASAATNWRVWILFVLYAGCFGIELIMNGNLAIYFFDYFGSSKSTGLITAVSSVTNLFGLSLGGVFSDSLGRKYGIRGRLWALYIVQLSTGCLFVLFSRVNAISAAISLLVLVSLSLKMGGGCAFGIVTFIEPTAIGAALGIIGAGGNTGAVLGGMLVNSGDGTGEGIRKGFFILGFIVIGSSFLVPLIHSPQHGSMFFPPKTTERVIEDESVESS